jgi:hypothetical protein
MSTFTDTFSASDGTSLDGYNGWHRRTGDANTATIVGNKVTIGTGGVGMFLSPAAPATTSVNITATLVVPSGGPVSMVAGVVGQANSTGQSYYGLWHNGFTNQLQLYAFVSGTGTLLGSTSLSLSPGTYQLELDLRPGQQKGLWNGTVLLSATDTSVPAGSISGLTFNNTAASGTDLVSAFGTADAGPSATPDDPRLANAYSPLQWRITSSAAVATTLGSEMNFTFTGTSCVVGLDLSHWSSASSGYPVLAYTIDDGPQTQVQLTSGQSSLAIATGKSSGTHTAKLTYIMANNTSMSRWTDDGSGGGPACSLRITGITVDSGCTVASSAAYSNLLLLLGDSISECDYTFADSFLTGDPRTDYSYNIGEAMGYVTSRIAYAGTGYTATASDGVPPVGTYWKNFDSVHTRPISSVGSNIKVVVVVHGVNDISASSSAVQSAAQALYADLLSELPEATILVYVPFGQAIAATITAAVAATANSRVKLRNLGTAYSTGLTNSGSATYQSADGTHPNTMTHTLLRGAMVADIQDALGTIQNSGGTGSSHSVGGGLLCGA